MFKGAIVRLFLAMTAMLVLGGCGLVAHMDAQSHYNQSLADYRACLAANDATPQACEAKRVLVETDSRAMDKAYGHPDGGNYDIIVRNR